MTKEEALEKVRKCLALAQSDNPNEAALALKKAREIMKSYAISEAEALENKERGEDDYTLSFFAPNRLYAWKKRLAGSIVSYMGCVTVNSGFEGRFFYGREAQVMASNAMYDYLVKTINRLAKESGLKGRRALLSFRLGCAEKIYDRLEEQKKRFMEYECEALVVADFHKGTQKAKEKFLAENSDARPNNQSISTPIDSSAFDQGVEEGKNITLNEQIHA